MMSSAKKSTNSSQILSNEDASDFMAYLPQIIYDLVQSEPLSKIPLVKDRLKKILEYNTLGINCTSPHILIYCSKCMQNGSDNSNPEKIEQVYKLAWCLEILIVFSLMLDDILEGAEYRSNQKSWNKIQGQQSLSDIYLLLSSCLQLVGKYFSHHKNYAPILKILIEAGFKTAIGEILQYELKNLKNFTIKNFETIGSLKTAVLGFIVPFQLACLLSDRENYLEDEHCVNIMEQIGICFQIENDFMDCYGELEQGKLGNDIQENVCSMLIAVALQKANEEQKKILTENYGHYDPEKVERVKEIYAELQIEKCFTSLIDQSKTKTSIQLEKIDDISRRRLMENILDKSYMLLLQK